MRISVSKVAGIAGLHPFSDVQELFEEALYQCTDLRMHDQATLGVSLQTEQQAAVATVDALASSSVPAITALGKSMSNILAQRQSDHTGAVKALGSQAGALVRGAVACGALSSPRKARRLEAALRSAVYTDFGTRHENDAIRLYERQTGCQVGEANEHLLLQYWHADPLRPPEPLRRVPLRARSSRSRGSDGSITANCSGASCGWVLCQSGS